MSASDPKRTFKGAFSNRRDLPFMGPTWRIGYLPSSPHETGPIGRAIYNSRSKPPSPAASMHPPYPPGGLLRFVALIMSAFALPALASVLNWDSAI